MITILHLFALLVCRSQKIILEGALAGQTQSILIRRSECQSIMQCMRELVLELVCL